MPDFAWPYGGICAKKVASRSGVDAPSPALEHNHLLGGVRMSRWTEYGDSATNFKIEYSPLLGDAK